MLFDYWVEGEFFIPQRLLLLLQHELLLYFFLLNEFKLLLSLQEVSLRAELYFLLIEFAEVELLHFELLLFSLLPQFFFNPFQSLLIELLHSLHELPKLNQRNRSLWMVLSPYPRSAHGRVCGFPALETIWRVEIWRALENFPLEAFVVTLKRLLLY